MRKFLGSCTYDAYVFCFFSFRNDYLKERENEYNKYKIDNLILLVNNFIKRIEIIV